MGRRERERYQAGGGEKGWLQECIPAKTQVLWKESKAIYEVTHHALVGIRDQGSVRQECCVTRKGKQSGSVVMTGNAGKVERSTLEIRKSQGFKYLENDVTHLPSGDSTVARSLRDPPRFTKGSKR